MLTYEVNNRQRLNVYKNCGRTIVSHMDADTGFIGPTASMMGI